MAATTLRDVARLAGVSVSTASRALNNDPSRTISAATRERIAEAARQLNYVPNASARRLVRGVAESPGPTCNIGLILGNVSYKFADPFWAPVLNGIDDELARREYHLRFAFLENDLRRAHRRRLVSPAHVDGLLLVGGVSAFEHAIPHERIVLIEDDRARRSSLQSGTLCVDIVAIEKRQSMYAVIDHLLGLGRRQLAFLGPRSEMDERAEAFMDAVAHRGLRGIMIESPWTSEGAYPVARAFLEREADAVDALVCACDTIAVGAMRAAKERGMRVPDDVAITGFDDIAYARDLDPPLTTVHVPKELLGVLAVRKLIERLAEPTLPPVIQTVPARLVVRASCGADERG